MGEAFEIICRGLHAVGAVAAHHVVGRGADVGELRVKAFDRTLQRALQRGRRKSLVAATVEGYRRVMPDVTDKVARVLHEHSLVVGVGPVPWVGEPEVLPYHDAVFVASVVEFLVANLPHPVADNVEVHVAVVAHGGVVLASAIAQVSLGEPPVAAQWVHALAVDEELQPLAPAVGRGLKGGAHLSQSGLEAERAERVGAAGQGEAGVVEVRVAIAIGPP